MEEKVFDPVLVTGNRDDHKKLAKAIAEFMASDTSVPEGGDDRKRWNSDRIFREQLEAELVQRGKGNEDLKNFIDVCVRARAEKILENCPSSRAFLLIAGWINALRRIKPPNITLLEALFANAAKEVDALPDDRRKVRVSSLLEYNIGIYLRDVSVNYELSLAAQKRAANKAKKGNDLIGEAIARFCRAYDKVNLALQEGEEGKYSDLIKYLRKKAKKIRQDFTDETPTERAWKYLSVPIHSVFSQFWTNLKCKPETAQYYLDFLEELDKVDPDYYERHQSLAVVGSAVCHFLRGRTKIAINIVENIITELDGQAMVTAQLMMARNAAAQGNTQRATSLYEEIIKGDHRMEQVRAVAKRERAR